MIQLEETSRGIVLRVKVQAGSRRNGLAGVHDGALKVCVTQAPEKGKANEAVATLLAEQLGLKRNQLEVIAGPTSPHKKFLITGASPAELLARLERFVN